MTALTPIPSASVITATEVNPGERRSDRAAKAKSPSSPLITAGAPRVAARLAILFEPPEITQRGEARFFGRHPRGDVFGHEHIEVKLHLAVQFRFLQPAPKKPAPTQLQPTEEIAAHRHGSFIASTLAIAAVKPSQYSFSSVKFFLPSRVSR